MLDENANVEDYTYLPPKDHRYSWPSQGVRRRILFRWAGRRNPLKEKKNQLCDKYELSICKLILTFYDLKKKNGKNKLNAVFYNKKKGWPFFFIYVREDCSYDNECRVNEDLAYIGCVG
jgi:hypothetical protein